MSEQTIHVLSIEDNPAEAVLIQEKVKAAQHIGWNLPHFEIEHVTRLKTALARLEADGESIDVVLSDLDLPDSRAGETVATLREHIPDMPLVVLTGREDEVLAHQSVRAGVQDYLYKNEITGSLLIRTLVYAIERQQVHAQLEQRVEERTVDLRQANEELRQANQALESEIVKRQRIEKSLRDSERRLRSTFEQAAVGIAHVAGDGQFLRVNQRFCDIVRYTRKDLLAYSFQDITHPDDLEADLGHMEQLLAGEKSTFSMEKRYIRPDDSPVWVNMTVSLVREASGDPKYFISVFEDITERKQAEEQLAFQSMLLEQIQDMVTATDLEGRITYVNQAECRAFGKTADELVGQHVESYGEDPERGAIQQEIIENTLREGQWRGEVVNVAEDGREVTLDCRTRLIRDEQGEPIGMLGISTDITERKRMEEALERRAEDLKAINELAINLTTAPSSADHLELTADVLKNITHALAVVASVYDPEEQALIVKYLAAKGERIARMNELLARRVEGFLMPVSDELYAQITQEVERKVPDLHAATLGAIPKPVSTAAQRVFGIDHCISLAFTDRDELWGSAVIVMPKEQTSPSNEVMEVFARVTAASLRQRQAEAALLKSEERFRLIAESSVDVIFQLDLEGRITYCSPAAERVLGFAPDEVTGAHLTRFFSRSGQVEALHNFEKVIATGCGVTLEAEIIDHTRAPVPIEASLAPIKNNGQVVGVQGHARDVTERKQMENALQESLARYNELVARVPVGVYVVCIGADGRMDFEYVSDRWCEIHQVSREAVLTDAAVVNDLVHPDEREQFLARNRDAKDNLEPFLWEGRFIIEGEVHWLQIESTPTVMDNGDTRWFGATQDITARKQAEEALRESKARYQQLAESAEAILWEYDVKANRWTYVAPQVTRILGCPPEAWTDLQFWVDHLHPEDREWALPYCLECANRGEPHTFEYRFLKKDGGVVWIRDVVSVEMEDGQPVKLRGFMMDITERKRMEMRIKENEARYKKAQRLGQVGNWEYNVQTARFWGSDEAKRIYGFDPAAEDFSVNEVESCIPDRERVHQALIDLIKKNAEYDLEFEIHPKNSDQTKTIVSIAELERDARGNPLKVIGVIQDITDRKRMEQELRKSKEEYHVLFESFPLGITVADNSGRILEANVESERLLGISQDEHQGRYINGQEWQIVRPDGSPMPAEEYASVRALQESRLIEDVEMGIVKPDKAVTWINVTATPLMDDRVVITYNDITERRRAEEALRESKERFETVIKRAPIPMVITDAHQGILLYNDKFTQQFGYTLDDVSTAEQWWHTAYPDEAYRQRVQSAWEADIAQAVENGSEIDVQEWNVTIKDGSIRRVEFKMTPLGDISLIAMSDITERKQAERALRESEERFRTIVNALPQFIAYTDADLIYRFVNQTYQEKFDVEPEEVLGKTLPEVIGEDAFEEARPHVKKALRGERVRYHQRYDYAIGGTRDIDGILVPDIAGDGEVRGYYAVLTDITPYMEMQEELRQSSERIRIQHEIDTAILRAQSSEEIAVAALERLHHLMPCRRVSITKIDPTQQEGRDMIVLIYGEAQTEPEPWHPLTGAGEQLIVGIQQGQTYRVDDIAVLETPSPLDQKLASVGIRSYVSVPLKVQEAPVGTLNLGSETPNFFQSSHIQILEEIATSLAIALQQAHLLEQTRRDAETKALLLREINHRVKNNLNAIIGLLYVERRHAPPKALPAYGPIMNDLTQRITGLSEVHQMLSGSEWAPLNLSELAERIIQVTVQGANGGMDVTLDVSPASVYVQPAQAQHLALILSELTTNTLKYGVDGRDAVHIAVRVTQQDEVITLLYRNDGPGYAEEVLSLERHSAGLDIVKRSVRKNLRGELTLRNEDGAVTEIRFKSEE